MFSSDGKKWTLNLQITSYWHLKLSQPQEAIIVVISNYQFVDRISVTLPVDQTLAGHVSDDLTNLPKGFKCSSFSNIWHLRYRKYILRQSSAIQMKKQKKPSSYHAASSSHISFPSNTCRLHLRWPDNQIDQFHVKCKERESKLIWRTIILYSKTDTLITTNISTHFMLLLFGCNIVG